MPEGDTVFRAAARLRRGLAGHTLTRSDFRTPALATKDLSGRKVTDVRARGKHLFIDIAAAPELSGGDAVSIHSHLKMEGAWHVHRVGSKWRRPAHQARVVLSTASVEAVGFELGILELLTDPVAAVSHLGPDLLGADWDAAQAVSRLSADPELPLGLALLDQRLMAGVGNEYRAEICFLTGYLPSRPMAEVDATRVVDLAHRLLMANRDRPARTTTGNTRTGSRLWVYGRRGQPCRRCATPIERTLFGGASTNASHAERVVYLCPRCQS